MAVSARQTAAAELVASHYNAVPERGRTWRKTDSEIKGLRSLNNWVKSTLIQKFSVPEDAPPGQSLLVLDIACGKGGDLGKWEKAPVVPSLYIGCDIADVSVEQARARWEEMGRKSRGMGKLQAEFYVHDAFSRSLAEVPRVRQVGFNPNAGPGGSGAILPGMGSGGFDVVSIMFALHYSYESETLARGFLKNVAGALKKGGRFIGVMPDSDVISATVKRLLLAEGMGKTPKGGVASPKEDEEEGEIKEDEQEEDDWDPEKPSEPQPNGSASAVDGDDDDWDPEKPSEPQPQSAITNGTTANGAEEDEDNWDPEKPAEPSPNTTTANPPSTSPQPPSTSPTKQPPAPHSTTHLPPLEWGNKIYTIRFPHNQPLTQRPLPRDGIFRPPYGWRYHYHLAEAVDVPEYVVPWEAFRALAEEYGLELLYRKGFREVLEDEGRGDVSGDPAGLGRLAERMGVLDREGRLLVGSEEMEAAGFYHAFCFYRV